MDPDRDQDRTLSSQAVTASDLEVGQPNFSRPSTPLRCIMEDREKSDEQAVRDIADPVMKAMFLAIVTAKDQDQDQDGEAFVKLAS